MDNDKYIGRLLDNRYEILEVIGVGGMAVVYKARCHRLNRLVAIKILKDDYNQDEEFRRRFHAEGQAVAMVSHPNIVSVYDVSTSSEADYIVMELIDGISLKQYMEKKGVLNWKETLHFAIQIGKALEQAHSRGIVHRDIKPHNVMVLKNGSVKVADFGIARLMSESHTLTREALGSVHYISPEQAKGGRVDDRSDIYSLGVVMYEMITGRPPYNGESPVAVAIQHINGGAKMPSTLNPNIPGGLEQIIMKAMAHEPGERYSSAGAMLYDMDEFRKLPSILFDYNIPHIDDVTRLPGAAAAAAVVQQPRTTAERVAAGASESGVRRVSQQPRRAGTSAGAARTAKRAAGAASARQASANAPRKRREVVDDDEDRSKVATIAIIICSLVAVIAIVIFLIALLGNGTSGDGDLVSVPTLVGRNYDTLQMTEDLVLDTPQFEHNAKYEAGQITEQSPKPGERVAKGTKIKITVSLGVASPVKTMENLVGQERAVAENFLTGQGLLYLCMEEASETVEAGRVTRTDPAEGTVLTDGQTVTLYISKGPAIQEIPMPDVVGQDIKTAKAILHMQGLELEIVEKEESSLEAVVGSVIRSEPAKGEAVKTGDVVTLYVSTGAPKAKMPSLVGKDLEYAREMLYNLGFININIDQTRESEKAKNTILEQSHEAGTELTINTPIVLVLASGQNTKTVEFMWITDKMEAYNVTIRKQSDGTTVTSRAMAAGEHSFTMSITDSGSVTYEIVIDDVVVGTKTETFTA